MDCEVGLDQPGDINANINPKDLDGYDCAVKTNLKPKRSWRRRWKRKGRFRKSNIFVQHNGSDVRPKLMDVRPRGDEEHKITDMQQHDDEKNKRSEDLFPEVSEPSVEQKLCEGKTNKITKETFTAHEIPKNFEHHHKIRRAMKRTEAKQFRMATIQNLAKYESESIKQQGPHEETMGKMQEHCPDDEMTEKQGEAQSDMAQDTPGHIEELHKKQECEKSMIEKHEHETKGESDLADHSLCNAKEHIKDSRETCIGKPSTEMTEEQQTVQDVQQGSNGEKRQSKPRPNYFVAIPITNDQILDTIEDVQEHIFMKEAKLLQALIPVEKVHITILVAYLRTEDEVASAVSALMNSKAKVEELMQGKPFRMTFHGIGQFNNQVIYIKITESEQKQLCRIADAVTECFTEIGVDLSGSKDFRPHLTFLKLSKAPSLRRKGIRKICSDLYKEYEDRFFGAELLSRIDLCSMHKKNKESGYYYSECSILLDMIPSKESDDKEKEVKEPQIETMKETKHDESEELLEDGLALPDNRIASCVSKDDEKTILDITNAATISKEKEIKEPDDQPEAVNINLGEKACCESTPDLFPAEPIASTAVDEGSEK
ncbi:hypothetical protein FKM82_006252 [Ascaphus truei]